MKKFESLSTQKLKKITGGAVITGTMIATGVGIFGGAFSIGYGVGNALRSRN
ncbi:hypothetical protein AMBR_FBHANALA_01742 [Dolosigranulum pigrum]|uniref:Bacteriocin n=1 Tax=Dolosigranulum savutiense TaxID=3110288 RepID=A0AB74TW03_9LACT|nr:bacteriocin [Dolosigranulum pigrum]QTJ57023.1 bacteriocin [Dolosigranulum pigrum]VTU63124.1 hypothetical protein AMBR_FBHANALA_01742 [Dolosigranulum pigrum]